MGIIPFFRNLTKFWSRDLGIDLGTANTLVYVKNQGIVLREPSVVAMNKNTGKVIAVGNEAKLMVGRTPSYIVAVRPLKDGVIANFEVTQMMIRYFIEKVHNRRHFVKSRVIIGIPSGITEVEKRAVKEAALQAGAADCRLIEEPMASAIGASLPVSEPIGTMIIDVGGGTTEVAVISLGGIVVWSSIRIAGDKIDEAITQYIRKKYNLFIGERTAEQIKTTIGSVSENMELDITEMEVKGRDLLTGLPKTFTITAEEIRDALQDPINAIVATIKGTLEKTPPELASDILERGITVAGGGALLKGIADLIHEETHLPVTVADDPMTTVANGTGKILDEFNLFHKLQLH